MPVYYKNQTLTAKGINEVIDKYWEGTISQEELSNRLVSIVESNRSLVFKGSDYSSVIRQRVGKKRLRVLSEVLEIGG